jgi:hypothetical protein
LPRDIDVRAAGLGFEPELFTVRSHSGWTEVHSASQQPVDAIPGIGRHISSNRPAATIMSHAFLPRSTIIRAAHIASSATVSRSEAGASWTVFDEE